MTRAEADAYLAACFNPALPSLEPGEFVVSSKSEPGRFYVMTRTPEGVAIHVGEDCTGARFKGPFSCRHSKENSIGDEMTQALVRAEAVLTPSPVAFNQEQLDVIKRSIAKGTTDEEFQLFIATCTRTGLDPFMRQIYPVKRWDSREKKEVMAIQVGIDGMRLIAERTEKYAGQDAAEWLDENGQWSEVWTGIGEFPVAARVSVYRKDWGNRKATAVCRWDSYAQYFGNPAKLSPTWDKMPDVMLAKCAESLAIRKAFPAEMSALVAATGGGSYDPAYDPELAQEEQEPRIEAPDAIEGEVIQHGATPQDGTEQSISVPVSTPASDGTTTTAATPPADSPRASEEQLAAIRDWQESLKDQRGEPALKACMKWLAATYAYAIADGKYQLKNLYDVDAAEYIGVLKAAAETGELPAAQGALIS